VNWADAINRITDRYDRSARLYPALLVIVPATVLVVSLAGPSQPFLTAVLSVLGFCGASFALSRAGRNAGLRLEDDRFKKWGGPPTTQLLRHRDERIDSYTKARFHSVLGKGIKQSLPTKESETLNPEEADQMYRAATTWLKERTRDTKKYDLVFKENIAYGFHRNALGLRPIGLTVAVACVVFIFLKCKVIAFTPPYFSIASLEGMDLPSVVTILISFGMILLWVFAFNESALMRTSFAYAIRLLHACDHLRTQPDKKPSANAKSVSK
jgi:hypothetical protein